ncbi:sensor histidine kinase [Dokdonella fugitiva]|uniref:Signal transduction histidine kinase n=1 Tax=Dokdonella fugitiva TaxID=328517 RepID=A0A4R2HZY2_9GAMM|nr:sensor histidine kinase [Dokdonella fugitiva]TCO37283.1 signal transduction histidine kinase [Dokdonella fugitiva]
MTLLRPRLRGLVVKLALFYALLALPTLVLVEAVILSHEFQQMMRGLAEGSLERAADAGADEFARRWPELHGVDEAARVGAQAWLDGWVLRLQQPRGGLTPDASYLLLELSERPLSAALLDLDGRERVVSPPDRGAHVTAPSATDFSRARAAGHAVALPGSDEGRRLRRALAPLRDAQGRDVGWLALELHLPSPWRHLLSESSFESPTVFGFLVVFGIASSLFLAGWVTRRLNRIAYAANAWSRGDFGDHIGDHSGDELGALSTLLDRMALDLKGLLRTRAQLATLAERQRLARDLHDTVKQKAFALNLQLATARRIAADPTVADRLEQAQRLTQQIQQELAQILDELRASDAELPFAERLRTRAVEWAHLSGIAVETTLDDVPPQAAPVEESLLRIVDEALSNVLRHSGASRVEVRLARQQERVELVIADNGRGAPEAPAAGMGLRNLRERALLLPGGHLELAPRPEGGLRVAVSFNVVETADQ